MDYTLNDHLAKLEESFIVLNLTYTFGRDIFELMDINKITEDVKDESVPIDLSFLNDNLVDDAPNIQTVRLNNRINNSEFETSSDPVETETINDNFLPEISIENSESEDNSTAPSENDSSIYILYQSKKFPASRMHQKLFHCVFCGRIGICLCRIWYFLCRIWFFYRI